MSGSAIHRSGQPHRSGAPPAAAVGMVADEATCALLTRTADARGIPCSFQVGSVADAIAILAPEEPVDCIVIEITDPGEEIDDVAILASNLPNQTKLVLLGDFSVSDESEFRAAGAALCIVKANLSDELNAIFGVPVRRTEVVAHPPRPPAEPKTNPTSRVIATIGQSPAPALPTALAPAPPAPPPVVEHPVVAAPAPLALGVPDKSAAIVLSATEPPARAIDEATFSNRAEPATRSREWSDPPPSYREPPTVPVRKIGRVIIVLGCRGGVGSTSIAVSLAWLLSEENGVSTALLDLDPHFGSIALALNLDPGEGLPQALERPNRVDTLFVDRAVRKFGQNLYVLSSERSLDSPLRSDPTAAASLIRTLSQRHERVVIDLPRQDPEAMLRVLSLADEIVLVTDLSLAGARDAVRLMGLVRKATSYARVRLVGAGARDNGKTAALTPSEFRKAAGLAFELAIAHDPESASEAARTGKPIAKIAPRSALSKTLRTLMQSLEPAEQRERKRRLLFWKH
jgi:MinD-like ATPase involved in chromosome partitioning or flagellar assembly